MKRYIIGIGASILTISAVHAQEQTIVSAQIAEPPVVQSVTEPIAAPATDNAILRAGTPISLTLMEEITTKKKAASVGQRITLEVSAPIEVNGTVVVPTGTPAWGEIVRVRNKGMWGKSGKLDAKLLYLRVNGRQIRLTGTFDDKGVTGTAGVVGAIALIPIAGFFMTGTSAVLPKGGIVGGFIDEDVELAIVNQKPSPMVVGTTPSSTEAALPAQTEVATPNPAASPTAAALPEPAEDAAASVTEATETVE